MSEDYDLIVLAIGKDAAMRLCEALGGQEIYIPRNPAKAERNVIIKRRHGELLHEGATAMQAYGELSRSFQISERQVRNILTH